MATGCGDDKGDGDGDETGTGGSEGTGTSAETGAVEVDSSSSGAVADGTSSESTGGPALPFDPAAVPESETLFPRAVFAGAMTGESMIVAGHTSEPGPLRLIVWQGDELEVTVPFDQTNDSDDNGFIKVTVDGLTPGQWYRYAFFVGPEEQPTARSVLGNVKAALAPDAREPVTIAMASCVGNGGIVPDFVDPDNIVPKQYKAFNVLEDHEFDILVHLGDQGYMDRVFEAEGTYEDYLAAWGAYHSGSYRSLTRKAGFIHTWDDHEVTDNAVVFPWTEDPAERALIDGAVRAYFTVMPIDATEPGDRLWTSYRWGETVEFIVLDCRHERTPPPDGQYIGREQMAFLQERLANSPCHFKAIVNSVPFATMSAMVDAEDRWEGYPAAREEVNAFIAEQGIDHVVWLTGDLHLCYVGRTEEGGAGMWEIAVTSGNISPFIDTLPPSQFDWTTDAPHAPLVTFDPDADTVEVTFYTIEGEMAYQQTLTF